jgi:poly(3-hydroxybutyrate) depolymerase
MRLCAVILAAMIVAATARARAGDVTAHVAHCKAGESKYLLYRPERAEAMPALLLLHGAGDRPGPMIDSWKGLAESEQIVLIAPELPLDPKFEEIAVAIFSCDVGDAGKNAPINARRVYVFGHSMGGYLAYDAAMLGSGVFAAVAVHAMRIADEYEWIVGKAARKTPVAIYIGDLDQFVALRGVRKTRDLLKKSGFPAHYVELQGHDHNYYSLSEQINSDAWDFLRKVELPE